MPISSMRWIGIFCLQDRELHIMKWFEDALYYHIIDRDLNHQLNFESSS
jgi:hypothetical protein